MKPPEGLVARRVVVNGEELLIFSYPIDSYPIDAVALPAAEQLTAAEADVARLVLAGHSNAQIATARGVTASTVAKQVEKIFRRFGVHSRAELAAHPAAARYR
jgi:DNA-binding CsgD family transcriptional regulator